MQNKIMYKRPELIVVQLAEQDVVTASSAVGIKWSDSWGDVWDGIWND